MLAFSPFNDSTTEDSDPNGNINLSQKFLTTKMQYNSQITFFYRFDDRSNFVRSVPILLGGHKDGEFYLWRT